MNKKRTRTEKEVMIKSAKRILQTLNKAERIETKDDPKLILEHVKWKFT